MNASVDSPRRLKHARTDFARREGFIASYWVQRIERWLPAILIVAAIGFAVARFFFLDADFPNESPWLADQAKFTDEGWWASAPVRAALTGSWFFAGDYNPVVALPVWPMLLGVAFHFTGVSLIAARACSVCISLATAAVLYLLVRRATDGSNRLPALFGVLLLASSPFAFAFSRLAILDSLVALEFSLAILAASFVANRRRWPLIAVSSLIVAMLLTKTTSAMLLAAILWAAWSKLGRTRRSLWPVLCAVVVVPAAALIAHRWLMSSLGYGNDYRYFFAVNSMPKFVFSRTIAVLTDLVLHGFWIDRVVYPLALVVLLIAVCWRRELWRNALFFASWLAIAGQAVFIFSRQDDVAPRYFLPMLLPMILSIAIAFGSLLRGSPSARISTRKFDAWLGVGIAVALVFAVIANGVMIRGFLTNRDYDYRDAAREIAKIIAAHPEQRPLLLGVSGNQLSLMTGIPSINDGFGTEVMTDKIARYRPGWYIAWDDVDVPSEAYLSAYRLDKMASFDVFDNSDRSVLTLYKMIPR